MCTGGDPGGGSGGGGYRGTTADKPTKLEDRPKAKPGAKKTVATVKAASGTKPGEAGRYTIKGGTIKTPDRFKQIRPGYSAPGGISPGAARAITGSDKAAANIAGRADINKEQLGNLQTRAKVGTPGLGKAGTIGGVLNTIGTKSASRLLKKLSGDTPTISKLGEKPRYDVTPVINPRTGMIAGVIEPGPIKGSTSYSGSPEFNPNALKQERDDSPPPPPAAPVEEPVVEVAQMGSGTTTKKRRKVSGRRTAFGTRQSLVNLRNV